jgi:hypothetical protein
MDRKRFVEAWLRFGGPAALKVSVPLLRLSLRTNGRLDEAQLLERERPGMFGGGYSARVLTGDDVDATEDEVRSWCSTIDRDTLRAHSYPVLFYEQVRSMLVHEYELSGSATTHPMTMSSRRELRERHHPDSRNGAGEVAQGQEDSLRDRLAGRADTYDREERRHRVPGGKGRAPEALVARRRASRRS